MIKESYIGDKALFLGNGIHRTRNNNGISWGELLQKISSTYGIDTDLKNELKPFPLAFEEMLYAKEGRNDFQNKLMNLKTRISEILLTDANSLIDNEIHRGFMQSGIKEIITTNYDYNLELSLDNNFLLNKKEYSINNLESKHSLYRGYKIAQVAVRHIHGELKHNRNVEASDKNYPEESIMIGFEHYSEYFTKIQSIIKGESGKQNDAEKKSILIRIRDNDTGKVWTDLFFSHHLIFAGFSFDFSENHLWWLLIQREELKRKSNKFDVLINNEITFCIPRLPNGSINYNIRSEEEFNNLYKQKLGTQKNKGVTDILNSLKVNINQIECNSYREFYLKVIEQYSVN
jgi:hypothetical protein